MVVCSQLYPSCIPWKKRSCSKSYILYILQKKRGLSLKKCFRKSENASKFAKYLEYENPYSIFKISCCVLISIPNECPGFSRHSLGHSLNRKMYEKNNSNLKYFIGTFHLRKTHFFWRVCTMFCFLSSEKLSVSI